MSKLKYLLLLLLLLLTACSKNEITKDVFVNVAEFNGYYLQNDKSGYEKYAYIKDVYYAINRENAYFIQFLELQNEDYAKEFFNLNKEEIKREETDYSYVKTRNYNHYAFYHMENDTNYMLVIRYKENILYLNAPLNYLIEIEELLDEMDIDY